MRLEWLGRNRRVGPLDALGLAGLCGFLVARFVPVARWLPFWGCPWRRLTGIPCPGCGLTRAAERLARGDLSGAFEANPFGAALGLAFAVALALTVLHLGFGIATPRVDLTPREERTFLLFLAGAWGMSYLLVLGRTLT